MDQDGYPSIPFLEKRFLSDPVWDVQEQASRSICSILAASEAAQRGK
jgi:hypothetical protein